MHIKHMGYHPDLVTTPLSVDIVAVTASTSDMMLKTPLAHTIMIERPMKPRTLSRKSVRMAPVAVADTSKLVTYHKIPYIKPGNYLISGMMYHTSTMPNIVIMLVVGDGWWLGLGLPGVGWEYLPLGLGFNM
jgi:hypothetical protein